MLIPMVPEPTATAEDIITTSVLVDRDLWARFDAVARAHGRSKGAEVRQMIRGAVDQHESKAAA